MQFSGVSIERINWYCRVVNYINDFFLMSLFEKYLAQIFSQILLFKINLITQKYIYLKHVIILFASTTRQNEFSLTRFLKLR